MGGWALRDSWPSRFRRSWPFILGRQRLSSQRSRGIAGLRNGRKAVCAEWRGAMPTDSGGIMRMIKHAFGSLLRGALALVATSRERRAIQELQSFDGRTLADIGVK